MSTSWITTSFNRGRLLKNNLMRMVYSGQIKELDEIIIVDDGSSDGTKEMIKEFKENHFENTKYIYRDHPYWDSCAIPKNIGLKVATGELLIFSEPEMIQVTDCITQFKKEIEKHPDNLINACRIYALPANYPVEDKDLKDIKGFLKDKNSIVHDPYIQIPQGYIQILIDWTAIYFFAVKKKHLMAINGWDEDQSRVYGGGAYGHDDSVTGDTPIMIKKDGFIDIIPIEDIFPGWKQDNGCSTRKIKNIKTLTKSGFSDIIYAYRHKVKKSIYKIHTTSGVIKVTGDHSLFQNGKEVKVSNLKIGDVVDCVPSVIENNRKTLTREVAWLFGFFAAEGHAGYSDQHKTSYYTFVISNQDKALLEKAKKIAEDYFCEPFKIYKYKSGMCDLSAIRNKKNKTLLFREKFYTQSGKKKVPKEILNGTREIKKAFLGGYFDGDGSLDKRWNVKGYTTNSFTLAKGLEQIMIDLDINVCVTTRKDKPDIFLLRKNKTNKRTKIGITKIEIDESFHDYVYDLSTESQTFIAGLGGIVAHNTWMSTRLMFNDTHSLKNKNIEAIHQYHQGNPLSNDVKINEAIMQKKQKNMKEHVIANKGRSWGEL